MMSNASIQGVFAAAFGCCHAVEASAPGRVNLVGEHTDYHQGYVLPAVIPQRTTIALRTRDDRRVRVVSQAMGRGIREYAIGAESRDGSWLDYVQGVTAVALAAGLEPCGFDAAIHSAVPTGGGVSSSAALTVALLRALREAGAISAGDLEIARLAQRAETDFVGAPIGIMDQMACSLGRDGEALFIDTRTFAYERIALPSSMALVVIDSGITHAHAGGEYRQRREESFAAARRLGVSWLRDATQWNDLGDDAVLQRRARHVITENARVLQAVDALRASDLPGLGRIFSASHASQRDDYQTSTRDIDALVAIAERDAAVYGARMTGGGFGCAVVMIVEADAAGPAAARILSEYQRTSGRRGAVLVPASALTKDSMPCA